MSERAGAVIRSRRGHSPRVKVVADCEERLHGDPPFDGHEDAALNCFRSTLNDVNRLVGKAPGTVIGRYIPHCLGSKVINKADVGQTISCCTQYF